ncbi:UNVERIFIED_CONTAM: hypothetical protein Slati_1389300 [Sesamum latifolium]|uniref:Uncharacterized protein n=1 Tax=Sesamum latifolium TaxID=2727402 RepID=A0AAW2X366_9LAMI
MELPSQLIDIGSLEGRRPPVYCGSGGPYHYIHSHLLLLTREGGSLPHYPPFLPPPPHLLNDERTPPPVVDSSSDHLKVRWTGNPLSSKWLQRDSRPGDSHP